jgi:hypothetical protein
MQIDANAAQQISAGNLVSGGNYEITIIPWDLGTAAGAPTDVIQGVLKYGGNPADDEDGFPILSNTPYPFTPNSADTLHFKRNPATPLDCKVFINRLDA